MDDSVFDEFKESICKLVDKLVNFFLALPDVVFESSGVCAFLDEVDCA